MLVLYVNGVQVASTADIGGDPGVVESVVDRWESAVWGVFPGVDRRCAGVQPCVVAGRDPDRHGDTARRRRRRIPRRRRCRRMWWRRRSSPSQMNVTWTASTDNVGVTGLSGGALPGGGLHELRAGGHAGGTSFSDTGLSAVDELQLPGARGRCGGQCERLLERGERDHAGGSDTTPPTAPSSLTATAVSPSRSNLTWTASTDNVGVTGYRVERCQGAGCTTFAQVATPTGTVVQRHRSERRRRATATGCGRSMRRATSVATPRCQRHHAGRCRHDAADGADEPGRRRR